MLAAIVVLVAVGVLASLLPIDARIKTAVVVLAILYAILVVLGYAPGI